MPQLTVPEMRDCARTIARIICEIEKNTAKMEEGLALLEESLGLPPLRPSRPVVIAGEGRGSRKPPAKLANVTQEVSDGVMG